MTEQIKEELKPEADAPEAKEEELKQDNPNAPEDKNVVDYKAGLEKAQSERDNYKQGMLNAKDELKKTKDGEGIKPAPTDSNIEETVSKLVSEEVNKLLGDINNSSMENILDSISSNEDEKALIKDIYQNKIIHSGVSASEVRADLENAKLMANKSKIINENEELRNSLRAKNSMTIGGGSNTEKPDIVDNVKLSPADDVLFQRGNLRRVARGDKALTEQQFMSGNK
ncbi:MAG: hypothetical protein ACTSQH_00420 [Candidatus Hodarchaeales archaeon]